MDDDLCLLRELADDQPRLTAAARDAARYRMRKAIDTESHPGGLALLSRRTTLRIAVAATLAAGVAGTAVVTSSGGKGTTTRSGAQSPAQSPPMRLSAAQTVLHKAADRARAGAPLPVPRNDQYIYSRTFTTITPLKGGRSTIYRDESWLSVDGRKPSRREELGKVHNDPPLAKNTSVNFPMEYAKLRKWPTDPDALLRMFRSGTIHGDPAHAKPDRDLLAYSLICVVMKGPNVTPPGLRAGLFEALAKMPRITVDHDGADAHGRRGTVVSYPGAGFSFVFDATTYDYMGLRTTGYTDKVVHGETKSVASYTEVTSQEEVGVVDRIGQRP